MISVLITP